MIGKTPRFILIIFFLCRTIPSFSQTPAVVISSYYNAASPLDEWTELVVITDNTNMYYWKLQDNNATQTTWQPAIIFSDPLFWDHMRAGTIIVIHHRFEGGYLEDVEKWDGYIEVAADDRNIFPVFSGGSFGTSPGYNGPTLNIDSAGDVLVLLDSSGAFVHALGHRVVSGASYNSLPLPKLNYNGSLTDGEAVYVCPGANIDEYGNLAPQDGSTWASAGSGPNLTFGLPNTCTTSITSNSDYWRSLRQPLWINPTLTGSTNGGNTLVSLNWNAEVDPYPSDNTERYIILRNTSNVFGTPADGQFYFVGDNIGGAIVVANIPYSQTLTFVDTVSVPCPTGLYYEIFAYRYGFDNVFGNNYNPARGSAYNETSFGATQVIGVLPVAPVTASSDRNNFCADDPGNITLSAPGGSGWILTWYETSCGDTVVGTGNGANNSITIPSPTVTTIYYARWQNNCGASSCVSVTVTVIPDNLLASISISANVTAICPGTIVTFIATPLNEGSSPVYEWLVNGVLEQQGSSPVFITNSLTGGESIVCRLTSSLSCLLINPVESLPLSIPPAPAPVVKLTDKPYLCAGEPIQLDAGPGFITYLWQDGSTGRYFTATNEGVYRVTVTDSLGCSASDSVLMKICDALIIVPDAFTPNDDGLNDEFKVVTSQEGIITFSMLVYNRWGEMVFESSDVHHGWDGKVNGRNAPPDTYVWKIVYQTSSLANPSTSTTTLHGTVTLIR
jgi:gliding motility-associated-like protein